MALQNIHRGGPNAPLTKGVLHLLWVALRVEAARSAAGIHTGTSRVDRVCRSLTKGVQGRKLAQSRQRIHLSVAGNCDQRDRRVRVSN